MDNLPYGALKSNLLYSAAKPLLLTY